MIPHNSDGFFVVIEGPDNAGKSTLVQDLLVQARLRAAFPKRIAGAEPCDDTPSGAEFRRQIRSGVRPSRDEAIRLLNESRAEYRESTLLPALAEGALVISDRYVPSTVAYQSYDLEDPKGWVGPGIGTVVGKLDQAFTAPDLIIYLLPYHPDALRERQEVVREGTANDAYDADTALQAHVCQVYRVLCGAPWVLGVHAETQVAVPVGPGISRELLTSHVASLIEMRYHARPKA